MVQAELTDREIAQRAHLLVKLNRPEPALALLRPAIASSPAGFQLHLVATSAFRKLRRHDDAIASARTAVSLRPDDGVAYMLLAITYLKANQPSQALEPALQAARLKPDGGSFSTASDAFRRSGDCTRALAYARLAGKDKPERADAYVGRALLTCGRWSEAEAKIARSYATQPDFADLATYLALSLIPQGRLREAAEILESLLGRAPDAGYASILWERLQQWREQESSLRAQIALEPASVRRLEDLATLLIEQDRLDEAVETLRAQLALESDNDLAAARLRALTVRAERLERGEDVGLPAMAMLEEQLYTEADERYARDTRSSSQALAPARAGR
jgi:tetratricopeptide (TPR) repeat protein